MANDMVNFNKENIIDSVENMKKCFDSIINDKNYIKKANNIKEFRQNLYS